MILTQYLNLFNLLVENNPNLNSYHYGWRSDINMNIQNNYDINAEIGKLYPHVHVLPPTRSQNMQSGVEVYNWEVYIFDLQYYNNDGTPKSATLAEHWAILEQRALEFQEGVWQYGWKKSQFNASNFTIDYGSNFANDRLVYLSLSFQTQQPNNCPAFEYDIEALPDPDALSKEDPEDPINTSDV